MLYVVHTQGLENYNLEASTRAENYWKYKFGGSYVVNTDREPNAIATVLLHLSKKGTQHSREYWIEYPSKVETYQEWFNQDFVDEEHREFELSRAVLLDIETGEPKPWKIIGKGDINEEASS